MTHHDDLHAPDLQPAIDQLVAGRPTLTPLELDAVKQRARMRAAGPARRRTTKGQPMKSRLAMIAMLALGLMVSGTGAGLAVSGSTVNGNAAQEQYPDDFGGDVLGEQQASGGRGGEEGVAGEEAGNAPAQPERQVEVGASGGGDESLPFTGFAAIPILLLGLGMIGTGVVMRRRLSRFET
jgi:hypothetical protein